LKDVAAGLHKVIAMAAASGDPEALHAADALAVWTAGNDSVSLESALGVASTWRSATRRSARDEIYDLIAATCFPDLAGRPLARAVDSLISRYETTAWPADRDAGRRPHGPNGLVFDLLALRVRRLDQDALRKTVGKKRPRKSPAEELLSD
jgi:hypothetical protein